MSNLQDEFIKALMNENKNLNEDTTTMKDLYNKLEDDEEKDVEGIIDDVLVITDPEITSEEYDEVVERAQEIIEDTPEGDIPLDEDYLGQYAQTCPICGATFVTEEILEPGATCPICLEQPEAFVMVGKLEAEDEVAEKNGIEEEEEVIDDVSNPESSEDIDVENTEEKEEEEEEPMVASEVIKSADNKLQEDKESLTEAVNMKKFGFIRSPEDDFSDDGNRFRCYRIGETGNIRVSYLYDSSYGYFISARWEAKEYNDPSLNYEEYSKLPHYKDLDALNGVSSVSDEDLKQLADNCLAYEKEYQEALNNTPDVSDDDFKVLTDEYLEKAKKEFEEAKNKIESLGVEKLLNLSEYKIKDLKDYLKRLKDSIEEWSWEKQQNTNQSIRRQRMTDEDRKYKQKTSWYLEQINKIVDEAQKVQEEYTGLKEDKESDIKEIMKIVKEPMIENKDLQETTINEVDKVHSEIDNAGDIEIIQNVIDSITDSSLKEIVQQVYNENEDEDIEVLKEFLLQALEDNAEYLDESKEKKEETGEWDDSDDEMKSWKDSMKQQAEELAKQINGKVKSVNGFDKYQGPFAVVETPKYGDIVLWYDQEDDAGFSFSAKVAHVGWITGGINHIAELLNKDEIPEYEILNESKGIKLEGSGKKRVARYGEFDNGHVLHSWNDWDNERAEEEAKQASLKDPDNIYYVEVDDIMNPGTGVNWYQGKSYSYDEIKEIRKQLNNSKEVKTEDVEEEILEDEYKATYSDIEDLNKAGDALNVIFDAATEGSSNFFNYYKDELAEICDHLDKILTIANNNKIED